MLSANSDLGLSFLRPGVQLFLADSSSLIYSCLCDTTHAIFSYFHHYPTQVLIFSFIGVIDFLPQEKQHGI